MGNKRGMINRGGSGGGLQPPISRTYAGNLDADYSKTTAQAIAYLSNPACYPGQPIYNTDLQQLVLVNADKSGYDAITGTSSGTTGRTHISAEATVALFIANELPGLSLTPPFGPGDFLVLTDNSIRQVTGNPTIEANYIVFEKPLNQTRGLGFQKDTVSGASLKLVASYNKKVVNIENAGAFQLSLLQGTAYEDFQVLVCNASPSDTAIEVHILGDPTVLATLPGFGSIYLISSVDGTTYQFTEIRRNTLVSANSLLGNNTGAKALPVHLSVAQVKTLLGFVDQSTENVGGSKTFTGSFMNINGVLRFQRVNVATSGTINDLVVSSSVISLTAATSLTGVVPISTNYSDFLVIINKTGATITLPHNSTSSTAANRFSNPGSEPLPMPNRASVLYVYDHTEQRWMLVGISSGSLTEPLLAGIGDRIVQVNNVGTKSATKEFFDPQICVQKNNSPALTSSAAETSILYADVGAKLFMSKYLIANRLIKAQMKFKGQTSLAQNLTLKFYINGNLVATIGYNIDDLIGGNFYIDIDFEVLVKTTGASGTASLFGTAIYLDQVPVREEIKLEVEDFTINTTTNNTFDITATWGSSSSSLSVLSRFATFKYAN